MEVECFAGCFYVADEAVDSVCFGIEGIVASFERDVLDNEIKGGQTDGEADDVKDREALVAPKIADGCADKISDHT